MSRASTYALLLFACTCSHAARVEAQPADLRLASLEDLMRMEVTSASRHEQPAEDVPAAIYVIGRDDIRRSGLTSVPELLRLAPGVQVARINSNKWAVSMRGFNGRLYSNKLLVMVDGRSIYNPAFSTVLWDTEDLVIEDIEHIEVIRGPGGTMWGANAVNGVINIITRPSEDTRGGLARVSVGTFDTGSVAFRYGASFGTVNYRLYAQGSAYGDSLAAPELNANDDWRSVTTGFRADWADSNDAVMFQGSATTGQQRPLWFDLAAATGDASHDSVTDTTAANLLGRWTRTSSSGASFQAQAYFDDAHRDEAIAIYDRRTWDLDAQYYGTFTTKHEFVVGGGYRYIAESMQGRGAYSFSQDRLPPSIFNAFAQDTIDLVESRLDLTLGAKVESRTWTGPAWQPNARLLWKTARDQRAWAAVSRAVRIPSLLDRALRVEFPAAVAFSTLPRQQQINGMGRSPMPVFFGAVGNPDFESERLISTEAGYRVGIGPRASFDIVGFTGQYSGLQTFEPLPPVVEIVNQQPVLKILSRHENLLDAKTRGAEFSGRLQIADGWHMDSAIATFHLTPHANGSLDPAVVGFRGHAPAYQWRTHVALPLPSRSLADLHFFHTGPIDQLEVPAFSRLDARLEWSVTEPMSVVASGQNLLDASHLEFTGDRTVLASTLIPRSGAVQLRWRF